MLVLYLKTFSRVYWIRLTVMWVAMKKWLNLGKICRVLSTRSSTDNVRNVWDMTQNRTNITLRLNETTKMILYKLMKLERKLFRIQKVSKSCKILLWSAFLKFKRFTIHHRRIWKIQVWNLQELFIQVVKVDMWVLLTIPIRTIIISSAL